MDHSGPSRRLQAVVVPQTISHHIQAHHVPCAGTPPQQALPDILADSGTSACTPPLTSLSSFWPLVRRLPHALRVELPKKLSPHSAGGLQLYKAMMLTNSAQLQHAFTKRSAILSTHKNVATEPKWANPWLRMLRHEGPSARVSPLGSKTSMHLSAYAFRTGSDSSGSGSATAGASATKARGRTFMYSPCDVWMVAPCSPCTQRSGLMWYPAWK